MDIENILYCIMLNILISPALVPFIFSAYQKVAPSSTYQKWILTHSDYSIFLYKIK